MFPYIIILAIIIIVSYCICLVLQTLAMEMLYSPKIVKRYERLSRFVKPDALISLQLAWGGAMLILVCTALLILQITMPVILLPLSLAGLLIGFFLPYGYYSYKFKKRLEAVEEKFMDFLIALVDSLKAGQAMEAALRSVTEQYEGPIKEEFRQMLNEKKLNTTFQETVARLAERNPFEDMKLFATAIRLTTNAGGKQVEVLHEIIETIRQRREFEQNLKTLTAEGRIKAKILTFMPIAMIPILSLGAPGLMGSLWATETGRIWLVVAIILIGLAAFWIHQIMSIEI